MRQPQPTESRVASEIQRSAQDQNSSSWMNGEVPSLEELKNRTGIDFANLHAKYKPYSAGSAAPSTKSPSRRAMENTPDTVPSMPRDDKLARLDKYTICGSCNGLGVQKEVYNHMVLEKACKACQGECILVRKDAVP
ncbi:unnamed protein product [Discosporangium mesarthrocarpum]